MASPENTQEVPDVGVKDVLPPPETQKEVDDLVEEGRRLLRAVRGHLALTEGKHFAEYPPQDYALSPEASQRVTRRAVHSLLLGELPKLEESQREPPGQQ